MLGELRDFIQQFHRKVYSLGRGGHKSAKGYSEESHASVEIDSRLDRVQDRERHPLLVCTDLSLQVI